MSIDFMKELDKRAGIIPEKKTKYSSSEVMCPKVNGIITVTVDGFSGEETYKFKPHPGLKIVDAAMFGETLVHALRGQEFDYLIHNIFKLALNDEMQNAQNATCIFLDQIQKAADAGETVVQTIFGLKVLEVSNSSKKANRRSTVDFSAYL